MSLRTLQFTGPRILAPAQTQPAALLGIKPNGQANRNTEESSVEYLDIKPSPPRGLGVFAKHDIPEFTRIVADSPLLTINEGEDLPQLFENFKKLDESMKDRILRYDHRDDKSRDETLEGKLVARGFPSKLVPQMVKLAAIFQANAFNVHNSVGNEEVKRIMFPTMARINHSCVPNAHCNYDPVSGRMTTYTLRHIEAGEEIEIAYFNLTLPRMERQARAAKWGFGCACPACDTSSDLQSEREARRERIRLIEHDLVEALTSGASTKELKLRVNEAKEMVDVILQEKALMPQLPIAYDYVAMVQAVLHEVDGDSVTRSNIVESLASAVEAEGRITGEESQATKRRREKMMAVRNAQ